MNYRSENTKTIDTWEEFQKQIELGGFVYAHWDGSAETEEKIKELTKATIRCIPFDMEISAGKCILTGNDSPRRVLFARAH